MGGGKKKSLANRLAKMSDEERARYLQHKADIEEEAKKRKEQLIAMFMKNKIKKEDGFSRLNLAKINQHWHQILRLHKCREMRQDVEHMKKYISRVLEYKNRTITKLMEELEMAEGQYAHNFQAHITHIDQTIASHGTYMTLMEEQYQIDLEELLGSGSGEYSELLDRSVSQHHHLQTVIFGQHSKSKESAEYDKERFLKKKEEVTSTFRLKLDSYIKRRNHHSTALWRQIAGVIKFHVSQTDARRLHLAELKRIDAESAAEIATNQERITAQEEEIKSLRHQYEVLTAKRAETVEDLQRKLKDETSKFFSIRKDFRKSAEKDDKQLLLLSHKSIQALESLQKLKTKGDQIISLMMTCRKFETEREQVCKWLSLEPVADVIIDEDEAEGIRRRKCGKSGTVSSADADAAEEVVKKVIISRKPPHESIASSGRSREEDIVSREFALLENMERFWMIYNKVDVEFKEMKQEKRMLLEQNKQYRGMIRAVLEAAALDQTESNSKVPTSVPTRAVSKSRQPYSAPLRRILV